MSPLGLFFIAKEYIMVIEKILSFGDYCIPKGESKATTYNDLFKYMFNQNRDLTALVQNNLWQPETAYSVDQYVQTPSMAAGLIARCTIAGTTSETEPTWGKADEVVTDGTAKWTMESLQMATVKTLISDLKTSLEKSFTSQISDLKTSMETKMLAMFPVGSIISTTNSANPSTYIGGTWEQLPGGYSLISAGDYSEKHTVNGTENTYSQTYEAGKTYGEMLHQLTVEGNWLAITILTLTLLTCFISEIHHKILSSAPIRTNLPMNTPITLQAVVETSLTTTFHLYMHAIALGVLHSC